MLPVMIQRALMAAMCTPLTAGRRLHGWHFVQAHAAGWQCSAGSGLTVGALLVGSPGLFARTIWRLG